MTSQMVDVYLPTTDGRSLILPRYTMPNKDIQILLKQMKIELPAQLPPKIYSNDAMQKLKLKGSADLWKPAIENKGLILF